MSQPQGNTPITPHLFSYSRFSAEVWSWYASPRVHRHGKKNGGSIGGSCVFFPPDCHLYEVLHATCLPTLKSLLPLFTKDLVLCTLTRSSVLQCHFDYKKTYKTLQNIPYSWANRMCSLWWLGHSPKSLLNLIKCKKVHKKAGYSCSWSCPLFPK